MTYRKFKADYLFTGHEMMGGDSVLVTAEDGAVQTIIPSAEAGDGVERLSGVLSPGFINSHCHLELSHMKGVIPEKTGLIDFLLAVMGQRAVPGEVAKGAGGDAQAGQGGEADPAAERKRSAIAAAEEAMLLNGIIAVGDICNTTDTLPQKVEGRLYYHNFIEAMGFIERSAPDRFKSSLKIFDAFAQAYSLPIEANSLVPHAPYSVSPGLFELIANFPGNHLLAIHNQESEAENEFYRSGKGDFLRLYEAMGLDVSFFSGTGKRSLESYLPHFYRNQTLILVHNTATTKEDLEFARKGRSNLFFCLCPNANLYISGQFPDVDLLLQYNCSIVVGTDSLASNHQLSILEELKTLQRELPHLSTANLLQWATYNGALALQMDSMLGSFAPGRQPGVLLIENTEEGRLGAGASVKRLL